MSDSFFRVVQIILSGINVFFILYLIGYSTFLFLSVVIGSVSLYKKKRQEQMKNSLMQNYYVPVSIIVPAHNEEVTVVETVRSLLALRYKLYEIIVVDDGSTDSTSDVLIEAFHMHMVQMPIRRCVPCRPVEYVYKAVGQKAAITLIRKKNGGKADSLNMGINAAQFPYFICMDADSILQYDSLEKIVRPVLENDNVVAVGGTIRAVNNVEIENGRVKKYRLPRSIIACMQVLEYDRSFLASRILFDKFNGSLIISGAFGLFKKDRVIAAGGYDAENMGEDMELVMKLHEYSVANDMPYRIAYATDAICWTQVPEKLNDLCRQRKRWHIGLFQSMMSHRKMLLNPKYKSVSFISYIYFLVYELFSPFIELFGSAVVLFSYFANLLNLSFMILFFATYAVFGSILSLTIFFARTHTIDLTVSFADVLKAVLLCFFEITILRFLLSIVRAASLLGYRRKKHRWGSIKRQKIDLK